MSRNVPWVVEGAPGVRKGEAITVSGRFLCAELTPPNGHEEVRPVTAQQSVLDAIADAETLRLVDRDDPCFANDPTTVNGWWSVDWLVLNVREAKALGLMAASSNGRETAAILAKHAASAAFRAVPELCR